MNSGLTLYTFFGSNKHVLWLRLGEKKQSTHAKRIRCCCDFSTIQTWIALRLLRVRATILSQMLLCKRLFSTHTPIWFSGEWMNVLVLRIDVYKRIVIAWDNFATHTVWIAQMVSGTNTTFMNHDYGDDHSKNSRGAADSNQLHIDSNWNLILKLTGTYFHRKLFKERKIHSQIDLFYNFYYIFNKIGKGKAFELFRIYGCSSFLCMSNDNLMDFLYENWNCIEIVFFSNINDRHVLFSMQKCHLFVCYIV